ncbi:kinase-like protein [Fragilariopsis cylindrus CCMP1102]|uniref:Kinase-like protein n=1 Tax=Fragilariopsis cylindrus CCMP1102 TaxID=635003 RepID=A0A1E7EZB7_9STRA|nr:kinase-like protein [Fragilariopsis cylindrus CCMP1102]|eukprot:OEU11186.1 kinase-like protein [Fragilariopsis cylindrus CCMP1102]
MFGSPSPSSSTGEEDQERNNRKKKKKVSKALINASNYSGSNNNRRQDGFDDSEGYYKASIGEIMDLEVIGYSNNNIDNSSDNDNNNTLRLRVLGVIGKGVFSSVLKCSTTHQTTTTNTLAVKCIRSNETMTKAAINEMKFLIRLTRDKKCSGIVPLLLPKSNSNSNSNSNALPPSIDFRGHTLLIFPYLPYNLRDVLQKFGKGIGLSLSAVSNYYQQLLSAALHLQKHCIIHCDIKPDNILVSHDFKQLLIADFGSAIEATTTTMSTKGDDDDTTTGGVSINEIITPYLVSRFYRSPEIILGLSNQITYGIDLWSLAVTAGELFLGKVLFNGSNNNDMLYVIMTNLGPFSSRIIRSHLLQSKKHPELIPAHFSQVQSNYVFRKETVDTVLDQAVHKEISLGSNFNKPSLQSRLLKARSPKDKRIHVMKFADLLSKCLVLDPSKRISVKSALKHDFFTTPSSS